MDKGGDRPNLINRIKHLNSDAWINAMTPERWSAHTGPLSKVAKSISARMVRTTTMLCDDITSCEALIAKVADFGETRTPGVALVSDPEATFNLSEIELPDDTIALLSKECSFQFDQDSAKRAISDTTARLDFLLNNHHWEANEIDSEACVRMDLIL